MDIAVYLDAIGVDPTSVDPTSPDSLRAIYLNHVQKIPFCSVPINYGMLVDVTLDVAGLVDKMLTGRLGGVCFEHATLMCHALGQMGFDAVVLGGEVWRNGDWTPPLTHASVLVTFPGGEQHYCDVGYSMRSLEPILLSPGCEQFQADGRGFRLGKHPGLGVPQQQQSGQQQQQQQQQSGQRHEVEQWKGAEATAGAATTGGGSAVAAATDTSTRPGAEEAADDFWVLDMFIQGDWVRHHRFTMLPRRSPDFEGAIAWVNSAESSFTNGWILSICRPEDGAHVSLAAGRFAGGDTPPDQAKYVVRVRQGGWRRADGEGGDRSPEGGPNNPVARVSLEVPNGPSQGQEQRREQGHEGKEEELSRVQGCVRAATAAEVAAAVGGGADPARRPVVHHERWLRRDSAEVQELVLREFRAQWVFGPEHLA